MISKKTEEGTGAVKKALAVLSCFNEENLALSLTEISEKLSIPLPTASRITGALLEEGFLEKKDRLYRPGLQCHRLGVLAEKAGVIRNVARSHMVDLRDRFNETVNLYVRDGKYRVVYDQVECFHYLKRSVGIGEKFPLYAGAAGRCFMAYMEKNDVEKILEGLERITDNTIMDTGIIYKKLEAIRKNRYEVSAEEREEGISCVAAPILTSLKQVEVVLVLTGPSFRFTEGVVAEMAPAVKASAEKISTSLKQTPSDLK